MAATKLDLTPLPIECGVHFRFRLTIALDLTGYGVKLVLMNPSRSGTPAATLQIGTGVTLVSATSSPTPSSVVDFLVTPEVTTTFGGVENAEYRLTLTEPGGVKVPAFYGTIPVNPWE